jgi:hypothetical protein
MQLMRTAFAILALLAAAGSAVAAQERDLQVSGSAGWNGRVSRGDWTPVRIDLDNRGKKDADLVIAVTWGGSFATQSSPNPTLEGNSFYGRSGPTVQIPVLLPAKSRKRLTVTLLTPDTQQISVWAFALDRVTGSTLARGEMMTRFLDPQKRLVGIVGKVKPDGLENDHLEAAVLSAEELPEDWQGYAALDALVWLDGKATELRSAAQADALKQWISSGGNFTLARGNTLDLGGTPVADLLPVKLGATRQVTGSRENHLPAGPLVILDSVRRAGVLRAATEDGSPVVVEARRDSGRVTFVAFDPARESFAASDEGKEFWKWLLRLEKRPVAPEDLSIIRPPAAVGSYAIAEQAGRFPDIAPPEVGGLFLLIVLYLIVVGPLDYFLLRRLRKLEYTWFTFPAYVLIFTLFVLFVGGAFIQRAGHQREIVVVDHYPETGFLRRRALSAVLAPADAYYRAEDAQPLSSNFIQQYRTFEGGGQLTDIRLLLTPKRSVENWLLNRNFTGLALADRCDTEPSPLSYTITGMDSVEIRLTIKNRSTTTFQSSTLMTPKGVYWVSSIPPGESTISGSRLAASLSDYIQAEGVRPVEQERNRYGGYDEYASAGGLNEQQLEPLVKKALLSASFPVIASPDRAPQTGLARSLEATEWLSAGGSILLSWTKDATATIRFDPAPARYTSVTLHRFFQGPPP